MPNIKSAKKRVLISEKARQHNVAARSKMRTLVKNVLKAVMVGNKDEAKAAFAIAETVLLARVLFTRIRQLVIRAS